MIEVTRCAVCGADEAETVSYGWDRLLGLPGTFRMCRCRECGLLYLNPRPTEEEMLQYYPEEYEPYSRAIDDEPWFQRLNRRYGMSKRCRAVMAYEPGGRLLDVGCATGNFLYEMARRGTWETYGVEPNSKAAQYARQRLGLNVFTGTLRQARFPDDYFDVVSLWNVLEHLHDPMGDLREVNRVLRHGGLLVLSLPNVESLDAWLFGQYWVGWDIPRHLHVFPRPTLKRLLAATGFALLDERCLAGTFFTFALSLRFLIDEKLDGLSGRALAEKVFYSAPMRLLSAPFFYAVDRFNKGSIITYFCRKVSGP